MICIMYESCLMLAVAESTKRYTVMIATSLATASIEETDNEKGMFIEHVFCHLTHACRFAMPYSTTHMEDRFRECWQDV